MSVSSESEGDNSFVQVVQSNDTVPDIILSSGSDHELDETKKENSEQYRGMFAEMISEDDKSQTEDVSEIHN